MEETRKRRFLIILFFGLIASLFAGFIFTTITGPQVPQYRRLEEAAAQHRRDMRNRRPVDTINIFLPVGERVRVDKNMMIYRGVTGKKVLLDVFITELDPQQPYRHVIPKSDAGKLLRLGGHTYKLKSISAARLKLKRVKN